MLDGFLVYNQVLVVEEDISKKTFITPWINYAYVIIPFRLKNMGATFQRAMDHVFKYFIGNFMVNYQDDLTFYSKLRERHIKHFKHVFERCIIYGLYLNPKKCLFSIIEGKILGLVVSK